jgi:CubicO group peptidase (beta-lactamase class C family)
MVHFSEDHDRTRLLAVGGAPPERAALFAGWDGVLPQRALRASATTHTFDRRDEPLDVTYECGGERRTLDEYVERNDVVGLLVLAGGAVVHQQYRLGLGPQSRFHLWSATKSFTSTVIGRALHDGVLTDIDDAAGAYADLGASPYSTVSIRHLLMMSSGVDFFHHAGFPDRREMYRQIWGGGRDLDEFATELGARVAPGSDFNYLATDTHVLGMVLRAAYGQPLHQIVQEQLWDPIGMGGDAFWSQHAPGEDGHAFGHACLCPRLLEFAHLGQLYIQDGVWDGRRLLPEGFVADSCSPRAPFQEPAEGQRGYGYQWWVPWRSKGESMALGAFGQTLWVDRVRGVAVAQLAVRSEGDADPDATAEEIEDTHAAMRAIVGAAAASVRSPHRE